MRAREKHRVIGVELYSLNNVVVSREDVEVESRLEGVFHSSNEEYHAFLSSKGDILFVVGKGNRRGEEV